jgi:enoyl-CoA hydratase/carnithine racemase
VGLQQAIQMMLTSTPINDKAGLKAGLLDAVVPQQQLLEAAKQQALDIAAGRLPRLFSLQRTGKLVYAVPLVLLWPLCCHVRRRTASSSAVLHACVAVGLLLLIVAVARCKMLALVCMMVVLLPQDIMLLMQLTSNQLPLCLFVLQQKPEAVRAQQ